MKLGMGILSAILHVQAGFIYPDIIIKAVGLSLGNPHKRRANPGDTPGDAPLWFTVHYNHR